MANAEQLAILNQGADVWNQWREQNPTIRADLSGADLFGADLESADLESANLLEANLCWADLRRTNLRGANLRWAVASTADFFGASLRSATLDGANFSRAELSDADLFEADLRRVDLRRASLIGTNLRRADLGGADLREADLSEANLRRVHLQGADFSLASMESTVFGDVDLRMVQGLTTVQHRGPSIIGIDTIYASKGQISEAFLQGAGVPETFITYMHSLTGEAFRFYSCFISHSSKDTAFVERLYADLQSQGVRCWYVPEDMKLDSPILTKLDSAIRHHDKLLLILSENSVGSRWVEHEVLSATAKESQQDQQGRVLFPIRLDNAVMATDASWVNVLRTQHVGDFTQWKDHDSYKKAFDRLLHDLKEGEQ